MALSVKRDLVAELLRGPMALAAAGMVVNVFNLLMNLALARMLDPDAYGAVVVQTNIFMILSVVGTAVLTAVVHRESALIGETRRERRAWIRQLRGVTFAAIAVSSVIAVALCRPVAALLSYPHPLAIAEAAIAAAFLVPLYVERGLLQARGNYPALAISLVFEAALRIGFGVALVAAGLGVNGAGLGLALSIAVGAEQTRWAVARTPALPRPPRPRSRPRLDAALASATTTGPVPMLPPPRRRTRDSLITDASIAFGTLVPLALLQNMDVVIVGWRNPDAVGAYAAISTACKVPVYTGLAVANFLLPEAARRRKEGQPAGRALAMAVGCVIAPGLVLTLVGLVGAKPLLTLVFGPDLTAAAGSLWVLALAMTFMAVAMMFATYLLGANQRVIVVALFVCSALTGAGLALAGGAIERTAAAALAYIEPRARRTRAPVRRSRPSGPGARGAGHGSGRVQG
ncbi:lipopolysaccharide biosynthesis protein, partial [Frankia nepalensis]|uniref:lipopolysaccharide biosynthesis protein n=1 Tax=Frankia nepalensis TaxID=1836974 RepID=UPI0019346BAA